MTELVAVDIGGTHARFALARIEDGTVSLGPETVLKTGEHAGLDEAWLAYERMLGRDLPRRAGIAVAGPVDGKVIRLTNNHWEIRPAALALEAFTLVNDFAAVAYAVPVCSDALRHVCGPDVPLPARGVVSVVGPGTGLGVAILNRTGAGDQVIATEGGHIAFAPLEPVGERVRETLAAEHGRVSLERVVSGPGLRQFCAALGQDAAASDAALWAAALEGGDSEALDLFCRYLGAAAGDFALAQGAEAVVIGGGIGARLADRLRTSLFSEGFVAKGRFRERMAAFPVKLITHPQPGLLGAAAAFAAQHP